MKYKLLSVMLIAALLMNLFLPSTVQAKVYTIKDVEESDEAYESIQDVLNQGWMSLVLGKFLPDKYITREEFALIFTKFNGQLSEASKIKKVSFKDVTLKGQYGKYIELQKNYVTYYKTKNGNYFKPKNYLTREDALVAIVKSLGYDTDEAIDEGIYSEVDIDEVIEDSNKISLALETYVTIGVVNELINLFEDGDKTYLYPKKSITRRQMAQLLVNAKNAKEFNVEEIATEDADESDYEDNDFDDELDYDSDNDTEDIEYEESDSNSGNNSNSNSNNNQTSTKSDLGYLTIELNGKEMNYKPKDSQGLGSYWSFYSDKYSTNNMFDISLPTDIERGDTLTVDSTVEYDYFYSYPMTIQYVNSKGERFLFGYPLGHYDGGEHNSSRITVTITGCEGKGGYVTGTMDGEMVLEDGEVITFTNGEFKYKLKASDFSY